MSQAAHVQELFHEEAHQGSLAQPQPWWKIQLFVWEPVLFGTWDGVFTSCMINIFGVVLFLRTGWLVGNTGVVMGMILVSFVILVALVTVLSGIGVGERCSVGSGGVYSMISSVLGGRLGGTFGLLYVFGQNGKLKGCPSIGEWLNKLWYMMVMEYYCALKNDESMDFYKNREDLHELMWNEMSRTRRTLSTVTAILWNDQL
ncbi:solute carrier family 12 member 8 isoform X2 [Monodelphis domestica]|uniref:solute carrier family 12 member 8 isoform X2 n=1 Tax=Monodelphis domestica TaxID=13616 RepID=UPI0024E21D45|nr:solute carrier family 12 member 8 isoform X2 [Monodelphis domestica]